MADTKIPKTFKDRYAAGKALREKCPRDAHGIWTPPRRAPGPDPNGSGG